MEEDIVEIVREIGRQQGQNAYYRACYLLLKQLQDSVLCASNDLLRLYYSDDSVPAPDFEPVAEISARLRNAAYDLQSRARRAKMNWEEFF